MTKDQHGAIGTIECTGVNNVTRVMYVFESKLLFSAPQDRWHFNVVEDPKNLHEDFFQVTISPFMEGAAKTPEIDAHEDQRKKGVPEKIFQFIANYSNLTIYSSNPSEGQSNEAKAMWERLRTKNLCQFNESMQRYFVVPNEQLQFAVRLRGIVDQIYFCVGHCEIEIDF